MNRLEQKNNTNQVNGPYKISVQFDTMPTLENNNILSENDEYCYELDQSTYSKISKSISNKSQKSNNSNTIQMISELSNLDNDNNQFKENPLKFINHIQTKNNDIKNKNNKNNIDINNNLVNNSFNNSKNSSYNYEMNELNTNNNNQNTDNIDNEWNVPKITFSEISKVSKAISSEGNEGIIENDVFYSNNNINNINNINLIKENLKIKKNLKKNPSDIIIPENTLNFPLHKKNLESKFSCEDNCRTINLLSSQYSNMDFLRQTLNNNLLKSGYKDVVDNSQKFLTKSSSLDFLNENSNAKPENEKMKKNLIMQMILFTNMKNEMEILKKENDNLKKKVIFLKNEKNNYEKKREENASENNKRVNEVNYLRNKIKKYKNYYKDYEILKNEYKNIIKKNENLVKNNDKIINENEKLKEELILIKKNKNEINDKDKDKNYDKEKKELINKINHILKENKNLNEFINKQNLNIQNLENNIKNQKNDITNYQEKIKLLQDKIDSKANSKNKKYKKISTNKDIKKEINKDNELILFTFDEITHTKNKNESNEKKNKQNLINNNKNNNTNNIKNSNMIFNNEYYKSKIQEKEKAIQKLKSENLNLITQNESKDIQIQELLNIKNNYNILENQNNEYKNEIKELKLKYAELIDENNKNNNLVKNNLIKEIDKLNLSNNQKENEIVILSQKLENMKKMITLSYTTLIDFSKKLKNYASKEFQKNTVNLFLKGFKEFIEKLNNGNFNENSDELQGLETICNFINLIPLEIEILYKRILSLKYINNNNNTNYKNVQNLNKNNLSLNTLSDISQNKKLSKYKTSDNNLFFKNKEIKINELNINELTNSGNDSSKKYIKKSKDKNKDLESDKNEIKRIGIQKNNNNFKLDRIKSSISDNFNTMVVKKIDSFNTIQINNEKDKTGGLNLKKISYSNNNNPKKDNNYFNINCNKEKINLRKKKSIKVINYNSSIINKKNDIENNIIDIISNKYNENNKNEFRSIRNQIINSELKLKNSLKKKAPHKLLFFNNEENISNIKEKILKSDNYLIGNNEIAGIKNNIAYRKKILHKINNFSVNDKENRKNKNSFNINSGKKNNNSFLFN